ncbi:DUF4365 domain-containing protein [Salipiger manganoxidans]|uniref:DUF4365 domain-containing protein n=1 Tax=Salipiger marinus TaxID=555512 RepID=UPI001E426CC0|nr:DUF4365 domain-containing protein [Salipiger manganoxidans]MCD1621037.1 DUF4365 domain-containing protein [Salipiger manganoxidans]
MVKKIHASGIKGEQGIAHIRKVVAAMEYLFYESGGVEAGIDGSIEIRDPQTGEVANQIVQFQSKATGNRLPGDSDGAFYWPCDERDIDYWTFGTAPVVLIVVDLTADRAYWKDVRTWFSEPQNRASRKVQFDKSADLFTADAARAVREVAATARPGSYYSAPRRTEELTTNLLRVSAMATTLYWAPTDAKSVAEFWRRVKEHDPYPPGEAILRGGAVLSFRNLDEPPWREACDTGAMEEFDVAEWALSDDPDRERDFVDLLNRAMKEMVRRDMSYDRDHYTLYFRPNPGRRDRKITYFAEKKNADRFVAKQYKGFWRHSAFSWQFIRIGDEWFVQITPTYHFTWDGRQRDKFGGEHLSKIKRMEWNPDVRGQFGMWRAYLCADVQEDMFRQAYPYLTLDPAERLVADFGVLDDLWKPVRATPPDTEGLLL